MDPRKPRDFKRLVLAVRDSYQKLAPFRAKRTALIKAFVGSDYARGAGETKTVYLYLLAMATQIYVRQLVVRAPSANITSPYVELRALARDLELACDEASRETKFGITLRRAVTDSLFSPIAVVKVGLEGKGQKDYQGEKVDVTDPFVFKVSFDDYVVDMSARSAYSPAFEGDKYYKEFDELVRLYPDKMKELDVKSDDLGMQTESGEDRAESMSHEPTSGEDSYRARLSVWDVWLPESRELVTYLAAKPESPLSIIKLDTTDDGPYHKVWYNDVPDNAMPMAPFSSLKNIHELANSLFRRMASQAQKQKRVVGFSDEESANRFKTSNDGDGIFWEGQPPQEFSVGGLDQTVLAFFLQLKDVFSWTAGNLDTLGGLSPMADTAKQEGMLQSSAGGSIEDMKDAVSEFARSIMHKIAWYEWTDPIRERTLQKEIPGLGEFIEVDWSPETRQGDFLDFNFDINPHSMREDSPSTKVRKLNEMVTNVFMPLQPFLQQQGMTMDINRMVKLYADYTNMPELEDLIVPIDPSMMEQGAGPTGNPTPKPAHTTRTYERVNRPGATRVGKDVALMQTMLGGGVQPSEAAAAGRSVG